MVAGRMQWTDRTVEVASHVGAGMALRAVVATVRIAAALRAGSAAEEVVSVGHADVVGSDEVMLEHTATAPHRSPWVSWDAAEDDQPAGVLDIQGHEIRERALVPGRADNSDGHLAVRVAD